MQRRTAVYDQDLVTNGSDEFHKLSCLTCLTFKHRVEWLLFVPPKFSSIFWLNSSEGKNAISILNFNDFSLLFSIELTIELQKMRNRLKKLIVSRIIHDNRRTGGTNDSHEKAEKITASGQYTRRIVIASWPDTSEEHTHRVLYPLSRIYAWSHDYRTSNIFPLHRTYFHHFSYREWKPVEIDGKNGEILCEFDDGLIYKSDSEINETLKKHFWKQRWLISFHANQETRFFINPKVQAVNLIELFNNVRELNSIAVYFTI